MEISILKTSQDLTKALSNANKELTIVTGELKAEAVLFLLEKKQNIKFNILLYSSDLRHIELAKTYPNQVVISSENTNSEYSNEIVAKIDADTYLFGHFNKNSDNELDAILLSKVGLKNIDSLIKLFAVEVKERKYFNQLFFKEINLLGTNKNSITKTLNKLLKTKIKNSYKFIINQILLLNNKGFSDEVNNIIAQIKKPQTALDRYTENDEIHSLLISHSNLMQNIYLEEQIKELNREMDTQQGSKDIIKSLFLLFYNLSIKKLKILLKRAILEKEKENILSQIKNYEKEIDKLIGKDKSTGVVYKANKEQKVEIHQLYKDTSKLIHPDKIKDEEMKKYATEMFAVLATARKSNDLKTIKQINHIVVKKTDFNKNTVQNKKRIAAYINMIKQSQNSGMLYNKFYTAKKTAKDLSSDKTDMQIKLLKSKIKNLKNSLNILKSICIYKP